MGLFSKKPASAPAAKPAPRQKQPVKCGTCKGEGWRIVCPTGRKPEAVDCPDCDKGVRWI